MPTVDDVTQLLTAWAPLELAEAWDNVGLLVGDAAWPVESVMTCLTLSPDVAQEAADGQASLVVAHHPLPFQGLKRLTSATKEGRALLTLIERRVAVVSLHTAFDSAAQGINQALAEALALEQVEPLAPRPDGLGTGRRGLLTGPLTLAALGERLKQFLQLQTLQRVGPPERSVRSVAVACGSAGSLLELVLAAGCDCLVTGELSYHHALTAREAGLAVLLAGHYPSERFALEQLAVRLGGVWPALRIWPSQQERDPIEPL